MLLLFTNNHTRGRLHPTLRSSLSRPSLSIENNLPEPSGQKSDRPRNIHSRDYQNPPRPPHPLLPSHQLNKHNLFFYFFICIIPSPTPFHPLGKPNIHHHTRTIHPHNKVPPGDHPRSVQYIVQSIRTSSRPTTPFFASCSTRGYSQRAPASVEMARRASGRGLLVLGLCS